MLKRHTRPAIAWRCAAIVALLASTAGAEVALIAPPATMPPQTIGGLAGYNNVNGQLHIIDGLPPATTVDIDAEINNFFNITRGPDGFGGEVQNFGSVMAMQMTGTGALAGYNRSVNIQLAEQTHSAPRNPAAPLQSFDMDLEAIQGQITGDPDFDLLRITAGGNFGLPSPGHTTLTELSPGGNFNVDSFFDVTYRIDFVGNPAGPFAGRSGSTTGTIRMQMGEPIPEPSSLMLLAAGAALPLSRRNPRRRREVH